MLHFMGAHADKFAFVSKALIDEFSKVLPSKSRQFYHWPYASVWNEGSTRCSLTPRRSDISPHPKGILIKIFAMLEYVKALHVFVREVLDKLPLEIGPLHVVGPLHARLGTVSSHADYLLHHPRVIFHGEINDEQ